MIIGDMLHRELSSHKQSLLLAGEGVKGVVIFSDRLFVSLNHCGHTFANRVR